jgi:hypothetical protein
MGFKNLTISLEEEQENFLKSLSNYSQYIREAIDFKRGRSEKSLVELILDAEIKSRELEAIEKKINDFIVKQLENKENLRMSEIKELEEKQTIQKALDEKFIEDYKFLESYPTIVNITPEQLKDVGFLITQLELVNKDNHRVGIYDLKRWFRLRG